MPAEEEFEQSSSAFNEVFVDDDTNKLNKTDCEDNNDLEYEEEFELRESHTFATYTKSAHNKNGALLLISDEEDSRRIEELQYDFETIAHLKQEQKLRDSANQYEKLSSIRAVNQYEPGLSKPGVKLNKSTCVFSILESGQQADLSETVEKQRGKTRKLSDLYKHLNKIYNYDDVSEMNSSSHEQQQLAQQELESKKASSLVNTKVHDWLASKNEHEQDEPQLKYEHLCDLNEDIYEESLQNMFPQLIADTTSLDTVSDIMLDATTLDVTQPVASRHAFIINSQNIDMSSYRSNRRNQFHLNPRYERLVEFNSEPKPRSFSADVVLLSRSQLEPNIEGVRDNLPSSSSESSLRSLKKGSKKQNEEDEEDYESYASCAEEIKSISSHSVAGEDKAKRISKERFFNGVKKSSDHKNGDIEFKYDAIKGIPSEPNTIQPSLTAPNSKRAEQKTGKTSEDSRQQKLKQFTISVFVDSFEDYSFNNKTLSESSTTLNSSPLNNEKKMNDDLADSNRKRSSELIAAHHGSLGELSKDFVDSTSNKRGSIDFSKTVSINKSLDLDELKKSEKKMDFSDLDHSLKEFELNEARTTKIEKEAQSNEDEPVVSNKLYNTLAFQTPQVSEEAFMFDSNPNNFSTTKNALLASKPPLVPSSVNSHANSVCNVKNNYFFNIIILSYKLGRDSPCPQIFSRKNIKI
jgi:hypothetical protein